MMEGKVLLRYSDDLNLVRTINTLRTLAVRAEEGTVSSAGNHTHGFVRFRADETSVNIPIRRYYYLDSLKRKLFK
jgi:hypothetical protein